MSEIERITDFISSQNVKLNGKLLKNPDELDQFIIPIRRQIDAAGRDKPTRSDIASIRNFVENLGLKPKFVLFNDALDREKIYKSEIRSVFGDKIRNIFLSEQLGKAKIWIEPKTKSDKIDPEIVGAILARVADENKFVLPELFFTTNFRLPTPTAILNALRRIAPSDERQIRKLLISQDFSVPSLKFISSKLDALRKQNLVLRKKDEKFVLTYDAIMRLGSEKNKRSPDIARLLALSRTLK